MKKIIAIAFLFLAIVSCNNDDSTPVASTNPNLLQKVIINPGTSYEKHWNFNNQGLLENITDANGAILNTFTYNSAGTLLTSMDANTFTYDSSNKVATINGFPIAHYGLSYDNIENKYIRNVYYGIEDDFIIHYYLSEEGLIKDIVKYDNFNGISYTCGGIGYNNIGNASGGHDGLTSQRGFNFDNKTNTLKNSFLPIFRALSSTGGYHQGDAIPEFFFNNFEYCSTNNPTSENYSELDPESSTISYEYSNLDLPKKQIVQNFYFGQLEGTTITKLYYYQGDSIP